MSELLRAALTETRNAFDAMPESVDGLASLAGRMEELRAVNVAHHQDLRGVSANEGVESGESGVVTLGLSTP